MKWPIGYKYKGWNMRDIPTEYFIWLLDESGIKLWGNLSLEVEREIASRSGLKEKITFGKKILDEQEKPDVLDTHNVVSALEHAKLKAEFKKLKVEFEKEKANLKAVQWHHKLVQNDFDRVSMLNQELQLCISLMSRSASYRPGNGHGDAKRVFRELAFKWHPDRGGTKEAMQAVNEFFSMIEKGN